jgi:hypothetical protein
LHPKQSKAPTEKERKEELLPKNDATITHSCCPMSRNHQQGPSFFLFIFYEINKAHLIPPDINCQPSEKVVLWHHQDNPAFP